MKMELLNEHHIHYKSAFNTYKKKSERQILRVRNRSQITELEHDSYKEHVIAFRKQIEFRLPGGVSRYRLGINNVIDNTRYNIGSFLNKLDEPLKKILIPAPSGKLVEEEVTRGYHMNAVVRYGERNGVYKYLRLRLILTRDGIKKILLKPDVHERNRDEENESDQ